MPRAKGGFKTRRRRKKWLHLAKGYRAKRGHAYRVARMQVMKSLLYSYIDRRKKKRVQRQLAILQINAATRQKGLSYSQFMYGLKKFNIIINRMELRTLAQENPDSFIALVDKVKASLSN